MSSAVLILKCEGTGHELVRPDMGHMKFILEGLFIYCSYLGWMENLITIGPEYTECIQAYSSLDRRLTVILVLSGEIPGGSNQG